MIEFSFPKGSIKREEDRFRALSSLPLMGRVARAQRETGGVGVWALPDKSVFHPLWPAAPSTSPIQGEEHRCVDRAPSFLPCQDAGDSSV
jgi:hypothetical protein